MAWEKNQQCVTLIAGASLTAAQYKFVKLSAANTVVVCDGATDRPIGVLQNAPASGGAAEVCYSGITKVQGDADLAYGAQIGTSADGQAAAYTVSDTTKYIIGTVIEDNAAAGGYAVAVISCANARVLA